MTTTMDKEQLAAFVDGALSPEDAARVVMHLASHPEDQAYVDDLCAANAALAQAFSAPLHQPVPEAILAAITGPSSANVVPFRPRPRLAMALGGLAMAASVAAVAFLLPGLSGGGQAAGIALGPLDAADPVATVLNDHMSGAVVQLADGRETMVLATFGMSDGRFCREFEVVDRKAGRVDFAVGCRAGNGWDIEAAIAEVTDPDAAQGFVPAGDSEVDTLTRFLERGGTPVVLDAAAETEAMARGWSGP
jgi:Putative zinc-finger